MCPPIWSNHGELYIIKLKNKKSYGQKSLKKGKVPGPLNRGYYQFFFIFCRGIDFLENERLVGLVGKTLATTATHRVQPENTTTFLDPARRAKVGWLVGKMLGTTATHWVQPDTLERYPRPFQKGKSQHNPTAYLPTY